MISKFIHEAVRALDPDGVTSVSVSKNDTDRILFLNNPKKITVEQIIDKIPEVEAEHESTKYQRTRAVAYPSIGDQLDALYHAGVFPTDMTAKIKKVKDDNPKG